MSNNLYKFQNGICGYAPQGSIGTSGKDGYSVHYSSFNSSNDSKNNMKLLIKQKKVLSPNPNYGVGEVINYKIGDVIITIDAMMLRISGENIQNCEIEDIGEIKIISDIGEGEDIFKGNDITYEIIYDKVSIKNDYNYIEHGSSPLYHHRDTNDSSCYGNSIHLTNPSNFTTYLNQMNGNMCKLVINFLSGLRIEKIITSENYEESIFIDNRYLYPLGHNDDEEIWGEGKTGIIQSYELETNSTTTELLRTNIITDSSTCMCDGYISFNVNNKEYIKKIIICQQTL